MGNRREKFRQGLHGLYLPIYDGLCTLLPPEWDPFYGVRTFSEQNALYNQGRSLPGKIVTKAKPGESPHQYGCASDWIYFDPNGNPIWLGASDSRWQEYFHACDKVGARKGHDFGDNPHNELPISLSWVIIAKKYQDEGYNGAIRAIEGAVA